MKSRLLHASNLSIASWVRRDRLNGGVDTIYTNGETNPVSTASCRSGCSTIWLVIREIIGGRVDIGAYEAVAANFLPLVIN